jgi:hypothetical protein
MLTYAAVPPLVQFVSTIGPPWPDSSGVVALTSLAGYVLAIVAFVRWRAKSQRDLRAVTFLLIWPIVAVLLAYIALAAFCLHDGGGPGYKVAGGLWVQPEVARAMEEKAWSAEDALRSWEYKPEKVWVPWTVKVMELVFLVLWLVLFGLLSLLASVLALYLEKIGSARKSGQLGSVTV